MKNPVFKFKQFEITHVKSKMKVGTDGVLLGAWAESTKAKHILDIGSGCGLIALMLAQKNDASIIDAVEPHKGSFEDLNQNFKASPWPERLEGFNCTIQDYDPSKSYDLIISNPPFFNAGTTSPDKPRHEARHTTTLPHTDLLESVSRLLTSSGLASFILPYPEAIIFIKTAKNQGLHVIRKAHFKSKQGNKVERILFTLSKVEAQYVEVEEIIQYTKSGEWTENYKSLTRDFYLKL